MNKYKKLAMNTVIFAIGSFGSKLLVLFLTRLYTANINPSDSSTKELLEISANFLIPIFTLSMADAIIRFGLDKNYNKKEVFTSACCLSGCGLVLMFIISPLLRMVSFLDYLQGYTIMLLVYICTSAFRSLCSQFVRSRGMVKLFSFDGILTTLTLFIFNIIFISHLGMGVKGFMLSVILSDFCSALFLFTVAKLYKYLNIRYFNPALAKAMLAFAVPLIPTAVMWIITGFSDRIFIRYMEPAREGVVLGEASAGIYGYATKIPNLISMVSTIFFQAWNMSAITENDSDDRSNFYEKVFSVYQSVMFIASGFLVAGVQLVTPLIVTSENFGEYATVYMYTPILVTAVLMMCFNQFLSSIYTATKHTKNSFWTSLIACVVNIVLNAVLIPNFGIQGASVATLISYLVCYAIRIVDARRYVPFKVDFRLFVLNTAVLLALCFVVIAQPMYYPFYLVCGFLFIVVCNYRAVFEMAKKILRRK